MGSTKHEKSFVDFENAYEQNIIGLKGIVYFGIGLFILIVITFGLMRALLNVFEADAKDTKGKAGPMALTERDRLPPEPRLQAAPGFSIDSPNGPVNLELRAPQSEYWELKKQWDDISKHGEKDPKTGAITVIGIDEAKEKVLSQSLKAKTGPEAEQEAVKSRMYVTDASAGRRAADKRR